MMYDQLRLQGAPTSARTTGLVLELEVTHRIEGWELAAMTESPGHFAELVAGRVVTPHAGVAAIPVAIKLAHEAPNASLTPTQTVEALDRECRVRAGLGDDIDVVARLQPMWGTGPQLLPPAILCPHAQHALHPLCPRHRQPLDVDLDVVASRAHALYCSSCLGDGDGEATSSPSAIFDATAGRDRACNGCALRAEAPRSCATTARFFNLHPRRFILLQPVDLSLAEYLSWCDDETARRAAPERRRRRFDDHRHARTTAESLLAPAETARSRELHRLQRAVELMRDIVNAVTVLHNHDVVHRQLTAHHVGLLLSGPTATIKLLDLSAGERLELGAAHEGDDVAGCGRVLLALLGASRATIVSWHNAGADLTQALVGHAGELSGVPARVAVTRLESIAPTAWSPLATVLETYPQARTLALQAVAITLTASSPGAKDDPRRTLSQMRGELEVLARAVELAIAEHVVPGRVAAHRGERLTALRRMLAQSTSSPPRRVGRPTESLTELIDLLPTGPHDDAAVRVALDDLLASYPDRPTLVAAADALRAELRLGELATPGGTFALLDLLRYVPEVSREPTVIDTMVRAWTTLERHLAEATPGDGATVAAEPDEDAAWLADTRRLSESITLFRRGKRRLRDALSHTHLLYEPTTSPPPETTPQPARQTARDIELALELLDSADQQARAVWQTRQELYQRAQLRYRSLGGSSGRAPAQLEAVAARQMETFANLQRQWAKRQEKTLDKLRRNCGHLVRALDRAEDDQRTTWAKATRLADRLLGRRRHGAASAALIKLTLSPSTILEAQLAMNDLPRKVS